MTDLNLNNEYLLQHSFENNTYYLLKLDEFLSNTPKISEYFKRIQFEDNLFEHMDIHFELHIPVQDDDSIKKELQILNEQFFQTKRLQLFIQIWKYQINFIFNNGVQTLYDLNYIWFQNIDQFKEDLLSRLNHFMMNGGFKWYNMNKLRIFTEDDDNAWKGRAKAYHELFSHSKRVYEIGKRNIAQAQEYYKQLELNNKNKLKK